MSALTLYAKNLRALRFMEWSPSEVCLLVGANGAGKSTVLQALNFLRVVTGRDPSEAVLVFGGTYDLKHWDAIEADPIEVGLRRDCLDLRFRLRLGALQSLGLARTGRPGGLGVGGLYIDAALYDGEQQICFDVQSGPVWSPGQLAQSLDPGVMDIMDIISRILVFHDPDITGLRDGSHAAHTKQLDGRGVNAVTMLRGWFQSRPDRWRYEFVLTGLRTAFPSLIADLDFVEAGNTIAARVFRPGSELPAPLGAEANGVLAMLVLLCDLAAAEPGGIVAIDEPENALHPFAIRVFLRFAEQLARRNSLTVVLATHSPVLLDAFNGRPEQVYVFDGVTEPGPVRLTDLKNPEWLQQFRLGELYTDDGIVSNDRG